MRRIFVLLATLILGLFVLTIVFAQEPTPQPDQGNTPEPIPETVYQPAFLVEEIEPPFAFNNGAGGGDTCALAAEMSFPNFGGQTSNVQDFTQDDIDPVLACMWGSPSLPTGYRTVWYKVTALYDTTLTLDSITSNYDTVLGVFEVQDEDNACTTLQPVTCNDDWIGFSSRASFAAAEGEEYYVVVASWSSSFSGQMNLNLAMIEQPIKLEWKFVDNNANARRTHHATVAANGYIYAIGGQTSELDSSPAVDTMGRYHPGTNTWTTLAGMPGEDFRYLTAVHVNNRIYVPGGDSGIADAFNGAHWVYNIGLNSWLPAAPSPVAVGWSQAVANADNTGYYLIGGASSKPVISSTAQIHNDVWFYDIDDGGIWLNATPMNTARAGHTAVRLGDRICVVGGLSGLSPLPGGECFRPTQGWQNIASLNIARFGAGSAVGNDGKWYVFGGLTVENGILKPVGETEVYDPANPGNGWSILGIPYKLVQIINPFPSFARAWPRGERIGDHIYAVGGNNYVPAITSPTNFEAVSVVQRLFTPRKFQYLPVVNWAGSGTFDENMGAAQTLPLNSWRNGNFEDPQDFYDFYKFTLNGTSTVSVLLNSIPASSNYDLFLFNDNKLLWSSSTNGGNINERIQVTLPAGQYYVLVQRQYGLSEVSNYWLAVLR